MKSDVELKRDVLAALDWAPGVDEEDIGVTVDTGVVTLSGHVGSYTQKWAAVDAATDVAGVRGVADEIDVRITGTSQRTDGEIVRAAVDAFRWNTIIPEEKIQIMVEDGEVTVKGDVGAYYERDAVDTALLRLTGVRKVNNLITIAPKTTPLGVSEKIQDAFVRHARLDAHRVEVETYEGVVILRGTVSSWAERRDAEDVAWSSPGVSIVENYIVVQPTLYS